jgi:hypothetical protein
VDDSEKRFLRALGARILSEANDLKRTPEALAQELSVPLATVRSVIAGDAPPQTAEELLNAMAKVYPVARADLLVERDDTDGGVRIMRAAASESTARVFARRNRSDAQSSYYEYRDTAMSRNAPFKPEWIRPLRIVGDAQPDNPDVAYNHGHLLHQQTFFIGEVNFYWKAGGRSFGREMRTGDSNYITPFVPHSFTSRNARQPGLIVAVTYAGQVRRALSEFARIGAGEADRLAGDLRSSAQAYRACLERHLASESLDSAQLAERLAEAGIPRERARDLANGAAARAANELELLASALRVRPRDLTLEPLKTEDEVIVRRAEDAAPRRFGPYLLRELARSRHQPGLKGFAIDVLGTEGAAAELRHSLHEYVYNYGEAPVLLHWNERRDVLEPGDSAYIQPLVSHAFHRRGSDDAARVLTVRVAGSLNDAVFEEYAAFDAHGRARVAEETRTWF